MCNGQQLEEVKALFNGLARMDESLSALDISNLSEELSPIAHTDGL